MGESTCLVARESVASVVSGWETRYQLELQLTSPRPLALRHDQRTLEDTAGHLREFRYEVWDQGRAQILRGRVQGGVVTAELLEDGAVNQLSVTLGELPLIGRRGEAAALRALEDVGSSTRFAQLVFREGELCLQTVSARLMARSSSGSRTVAMSSGDEPPLFLELGATGETRAVDLVLPGARLQIRRCATPARLEPGALGSTAEVRAHGAPRLGPTNRYRLSPGLEALLSDGPFQRRVGRGEVEVHSDGQRFGPADPDASSTETNSTAGLRELRAWVCDLLEGRPPEPAPRVQFLADAVRSRIALEPWSVGMGSAAEAFLARRGDCTEAASLLCETLRIAGLTAQVELGLVFVTTRRSWATHAWVSWLDPSTGRWRHVDPIYSALPRSIYLRLGEESSRSPQQREAMVLQLMSACVDGWVEPVSDR